MGEVGLGVTVPAELPRSSKLQQLQWIRAAAATLVVIDHSVRDQVLRGHFWQPWSNAVTVLGYLGVAVFFVISGYIMQCTSRSLPRSPAGARMFFLRRISRIIPLYWAATLVSAANRLHETGFIGHLVKSLLFIPYINPKGEWQPLLGVGWTLNFEMFFYLLFGLSILLRPIVGESILVLGLVVGAAAHPFVGTGGGILSFYSDPLLLYFGAGIVLGRLEPHFRGMVRQSKTTSLGVVILLASGSVLLARGVFPPLGFGAEGQVLVTGAVLVALSSASRAHSSKRLLGRLFERLGDVSYETYLFHGFYLKIWLGAWIRVFPSAAVFSWMCLLGSIVGANATGYIVYRVVDPLIGRPLRRMVSRRL